MTTALQTQALSVARIQLDCILQINGYRPMPPRAFIKIRLGQAFEAEARGWAVVAVPIVAIAAMLAGLAGLILR